MKHLGLKAKSWLRTRLPLSKLVGENKILPMILLLGIITLFFFNLLPSLLTRFDYPALERRYKNWMANPGDLNWFINDSDLYAYAGWNYVHGTSPDEINFEHPPLAKYLIGLSIVFFNNQNIIGAALGVFSLLILYELSKKLLGRSLFSLVPVYMLSLERIFIGFSSTSMLDIYLVFFLLLSFFLFSHSDNDIWMFGGAIALGLASACKQSALLAAPSLLIPLIMRKRKTAWIFLIQIVVVAFLAYCLTYAWFFVNGHNFSDFFELQRRIFLFQYGRRYEGSPPPGRLLLTLLTGIAGPETRYIIYVDEVSNTIDIVTKHGLSMVSEFNILTWPLCFSAAVISSYRAAKTRNIAILQSCAYFFSFLVPFTFSQSFAWYLLPVFPMGFLLLTSNFKGIAEKSNRRVFFVAFLAYLIALLAWSRFLVIPSFIEF